MLMRDMMTARIEDIPADATLMQAAEKMKLLDIGAIPVRENDRLVGMITDRDIAVRAVAEGRDPRKMPVREAMSRGICFCYEDDSVESAAKLMEEKQLRRLPVFDRSESAIGMVSLGDLAVRNRDNRLSGEVLERVSKPNCSPSSRGNLTMSPTAEPINVSGKTRVLGGITVIDTPLVTQAMDYARTHSEPFLFNHAVRSWLFAVRLGDLQGIVHDAEVVAVGCLLHDLGLTDTFAGPKRFEIEGADAARAFAREQCLDDRRVQLIWDSVALNSTPSIGLHKEAEVALCTAGIGLDFGGPQYDQIPPDEMNNILAAFPRLDMKRGFTDSVCRIVKTKPETTYDNFAGDFGERFVPGYKRSSSVDFLMNAPFEG